MQMQPMMTAYYLNNVTTDHIQQYLDENKSLIIKIIESQNSGKLSECAENQARLQRNLMYLAAIADSQPQPAAMHSQFPPSGITQIGAHYSQQQQAQQLSSQALMPARSSMMYSQQQYSSLQQQQALQNELGVSSSRSSGLHMLQSESNSTRGSGGLGGGSLTDISRGTFGGMHDVGSTEGRGGSSDGNGQAPYFKSAEEGN